MAITTLTSREFNQNRGRAKRAAHNGPVYITDRGRPSLVLLNFDEYRKLTNARENILDLLSMPEAAEIEFDPPRLAEMTFRPADFS